MQEQKADAGQGIVTARAGSTAGSGKAGSPIACVGAACSDGGVTRSNAYSGQSNVCAQRDAQAHDHDETHNSHARVGAMTIHHLTGWIVTSVGPGRTLTVHWGPYAGRPWVAQHTSLSTGSQRASSSQAEDDFAEADEQNGR